MWARTRSGLAVKARRWRARHGIAARRVAIRSNTPWHFKAIALAGAVVIALLAGKSIYDAGRGWVGLDVSGMQSDAAVLRDRLVVIEAELASVRQQADSAYSTMQIERSARDQLTARIRSLESENSRLREDMLVFESLAGASATVQGFKINRLVLEPDSEAGRYRYRMLIVRHGGKVEQDARGIYEIVALIEHHGQGDKIAQASDTQKISNSVAFRHFQRIDGVITVPAGAVVKSIEARFLQDGQIKARATAAI
jgi:hypothetical protein